MNWKKVAEELLADQEKLLERAETAVARLYGLDPQNTGKAGVPAVPVAPEVGRGSLLPVEHWETGRRRAG